MSKQHSISHGTKLETNGYKKSENISLVPGPIKETANVNAL